MQTYKIIYTYLYDKTQEQHFESIQAKSAEEAKQIAFNKINEVSDKTFKIRAVTLNDQVVL